MAWAKTAAETWRHEKVQRLLGLPRGLEALGLWAIALTWSVDTMTDGEIPPGQPVRLTGLVDVGELAAILVDVGLWELAGDGHRIHDFLDYNFSRDRILADRAAREEAARVAGQARSEKAERDGRGRFTSGGAGDDAGRTAGADAGGDAGDTSNGHASPVLSSSRSSRHPRISSSQSARDAREQRQGSARLEGLVDG
jgi:hypothetical protein